MCHKREMNIARLNVSIFPDEAEEVSRSYEKSSS